MFWTKAAVGGPIGLIAGQGVFPVLLAQAARSLERSFIVFGVSGYTDRQIETFARETHYVELGAVGRLVELLKQTGVKRVVLAGGIPKQEIYNPVLKLDPAARRVMDQTQHRGDDHLLKAFQVFLRTQCGVAVMDSRAFLKDALAVRGVMTARRPTAEEWEDLRFGYRMARGIGNLDIGQTVVVKHGIVLAAEALEGTDAAIRRGGALGNGQAVVVKTAKPKQDLRFDLPCVGLETLKAMQAVSSKVLGVESGKTMMLFKRQVIDSANQQGIAIVGLA